MNDDPDNIKETSEFLRNIHANRTPSIELMPYHRLGMGKYEALDRTYPLKGLEMASIETIELARKRFKESGIDCLVSK